MKYTREYFANYPSQAIVIKIKADVAGKVSFKLHPELPYLHPFDSENNGRTGTVTAKGDLITLRGEMQIHKQRYEGQIKVVNYGGSALAAGSAINVNQADSVAVAVNGEYINKDYLSYNDGKLTISPDAFKELSPGTYNLTFTFDDVYSTSVNDKVSVVVTDGTSGDNKTE